MCGTPIGQGHNGSASTNGSNLPSVMNTLKFIETSKGYSREIQASLSNEVGISWGGAAIAAIVGGQITPGKPPSNRPVIQNLSNAEPQQLSLFNYEANTENNEATINTVAQLPAAHGVGIKVDESNLERRLQAASGEGSLIKVQGGFQILPPGLAEVERLINSKQNNASIDESSENSGEVSP
nr:hypothetical protein [Nostoc sp. DedSLP01]